MYLTYDISLWIRPFWNQWNDVLLDFGLGVLFQIKHQSKTDAHQNYKETYLSCCHLLDISRPASSKKRDKW